MPTTDQQHDHNGLTPELEAALDEHIRWVKLATELAISEGAPGIKRALAILEDAQLRGMLFVMVSKGAGSVRTVREHIRDEIAREQFDGLENRASVTLH